MPVASRKENVAEVDVAESDAVMVYDLEEEAPVGVPDKTPVVGFRERPAGKDGEML